MFRFERLDIWKEAIEIAEKLLDIADDLQARKLFRFAEQLRDAALSVPNNIAEGSGSDSNKEFAQFINYAKRSAFENANMIIIFARKKHISNDTKDNLLAQLDKLCGMLTNFRKTLYP
jgi:four helix bundle protein